MLQSGKLNMSRAYQASNFNGHLLVHAGQRFSEPAEGQPVFQRYGHVPGRAGWLAVHFLPDRRHFLSLREDKPQLSVWHVARAEPCASANAPRPDQYFISGDRQEAGDRKVPIVK